MNEGQLNELLSHAQAPEPSESAKNQAVNMALVAFDQKQQKNFQGVANKERLTDINKVNNDVRRMFMDKKYVIGGLLGTVSLLAIAAAQGGVAVPNTVSIISYGWGLAFIASALGKMLKSKKSLTAVRFGFGGVLLALPFALNVTTNTLSQSTVDAVNPPTNVHFQGVDFVGSSSAVNPADVQFQAANFGGGGGGSSSGGGSMNLSTVSNNITSSSSSVPNVFGLLGGYSAPMPTEQLAQAPSRQRAYATSERDVVMKEESKAIAKSKDALVEKKVAEPASVSSEAVPSSIALGAMPDHMVIAPPVDDISQQYYEDEGRDKFEDFEENSIKNVKAEPVSTFSIDVDTASYSFMRRQLNSGVLPQKDAIRIEELINYFDYNYGLPEKGADPFMPTIAVYDAPWKQGNKVIHVGIKGYDIETKPRSNLVFLIDTSGSMNSPDKLPLLKSSLKMALDSLQPDDTVGIVVYAGSAGTVLEPTKVSDKNKIIRALEQLESGGSTAGAEGIRQAYALAEQAFIKEGNNRIILATDGDFNVGITNPEELQDFVERKREAGVSLSVLGFGEGNYNDQMMQALAQNGNGNAAYIDNLNEARKVLVEEANSMLFTIAKDVKIQVEFNPDMVSEYRLIGYETRHLEREDFNNDAVDAGEVGAGHTVTAIYEITPVGAPKMVDDLRYGDKEQAVEIKKDGNGEYAFLKIRYKKPDGDTSTLMTRPITASDEVAFDNASDDVRFAAAVAGFGHLLKGSKFAGTLTYNKVIDIASAARGKDEFGYRTEFVNLVRLAKSAAALAPQKR